MQFDQVLALKSLAVELLLKIPDEDHELIMRLLVLGMRRALECVHAVLLDHEMRPPVELQETDHPEYGLALIMAWRLDRKQFLQMIDVMDQYLMLLIKVVHSGRELFGPLQHTGLKLPPIPKRNSPFFAKGVSNLARPRAFEQML